MQFVQSGGGASSQAVLGEKLLKFVSWKIVKNKLGASVTSVGSVPKWNLGPLSLRAGGRQPKLNICGVILDSYPSSRAREVPQGVIWCRLAWGRREREVRAGMWFVSRSQE